MYWKESENILKSKRRRLKIQIVNSSESQCASRRVFGAFRQAVRMSVAAAGPPASRNSLFPLCTHSIHFVSWLCEGRVVWGILSWFALDSTHQYSSAALRTPLQRPSKTSNCLGPIGGLTGPIGGPTPLQSLFWSLQWSS